MKRSWLAIIALTITSMITFESEAIGIGRFSNPFKKIKYKIDDLRGKDPLASNLNKLVKSFASLFNNLTATTKMIDGSQLLRWENFVMSLNLICVLSAHFFKTMHGIVSSFVTTNQNLTKAKASAESATVTAAETKAENQRQLAIDNMAKIINALVGPDAQFFIFLLKFGDSLLVQEMAKGVFPSEDPTSLQRYIDSLSQEAAAVIANSQTFLQSFQQMIEEADIGQMTTSTEEPIESEEIMNKLSNILNMLQLQASFVNDIKSYLASGGEPISEEKAQDLCEKFGLAHNGNENLAPDSNEDMYDLYGNSSDFNDADEYINAYDDGYDEVDFDDDNGYIESRDNNSMYGNSFNNNRSQRTSRGSISQPRYNQTHVFNTRDQISVGNTRQSRTSGMRTRMTNNNISQPRYSQTGLSNTRNNNTIQSRTFGTRTRMTR